MLPSPRRLLPLLAASFAGAAIDNLFRFAAGASLTLLAHRNAASDAAADVQGGTLTNLALALFILPTVVLAPLAGDLGDRFSKHLIMRWTRLGDIMVCMLGVYGLWTDNLWLILGALFLFGCTTAFYSPVKYSALPELVDRPNLPTANAWIMGVTIVAILAGTALSGLSDPVKLAEWGISLHPGTITLGISMVLCVIGLLGAFTVPALPPANPAQPVRAWAFPAQVRALRLPGVLTPSLSLAGFWAIGAAATALLQPMAASVWGAGPAIQAYLGLSIAGGIIIGCGLATVLSVAAFPGGLPLVGAAIAGGSLCAAGLLGHLLGPGGGSEPTLWVYAGLLALTGIGTGLWDVPMQTLLQTRSPDAQRNQVMAAANVVSNFAMMAAAGLNLAMLNLIGLSSSQTMGLIGGIGLALALGGIWLYRGQVMCWLAAMVIRVLFRVEVQGTEHLPKTGGCLIASNHQSLADGLILAAVLPRRAKFLVFKWFCDLPVIGPALHAWGVIPVDAKMGARALVAAVASATQEVRGGGVVGIFPEGKLTRSGMLDSFKPGIERIARGAQAPIVPCAITGLWRTPWSYAEHRRWWPLLRIPVQVKLGAPLSAETPVSELRQAVNSLGCDLAIERASVDRRTLGSLALSRCFWKGHETAVIDAGGKLPRWQLAALATALRPRLQLAADERSVGILLPPGRGGAIVNLALALAGRTAVNLNHTAGPAQLRRMCEMAGIRTIISATPYLKRISDPGVDCRMVLIEVVLKALPKPAIIWHLALNLLLPARWRDQARAHEVAALVFSSGSTGDPKGVQLTHAQIMANCDSVRLALDVGPGDVVLTPLPLFHSFGLVPGMWLGLGSGLAIAAHPDPMDAKGLGELAAKARATFAITTATFVRGWMRRIPAEQLNTLRFAAAGAEKCPKELRDAFAAKYGADLLEGYGCTELAPMVSVNLQTVTRMGETEVRTRDGCVGRALPGIHVVATDLETRAPLPTGREGLLVVRSAARMQGYLGRDDLTSKAFQHGGYDTGDVGIVDVDGYIRITGRLARFAKIGGEMVPLDSVEAALQAPWAERCEVAVAAAPDPDRGERLIVLVCGENPPTADELITGSAQLAALWRPKARDVHRIEAIPRLGTGKRDLAAIKRLAAERAGT